jgi:hypothetical protein
MRTMRTAIIALVSALWALSTIPALGQGRIACPGPRCRHIGMSRACLQPLSGQVLGLGTGSGCCLPGLHF